MCGLIAMLTKNNNGFMTNAQSAFEDLLYMDTLRGPDSTGVFLVSRDGGVTVVKDNVPGFDFLASKEYSANIDKPAYTSGKLLVGHNRKATVGKVTKENAHPFIVNDEFVLVHNGSLSTHKHLGDAEVDSNAIAQYLHDKWDDKATPDEKAQVLAHIGGAWALMWYDMRSNRFNVVRNAQRPLAVAETDNGFVFASEHVMLLAGLSRNSISVKSSKNLEPYKLLSFDLEAQDTKVEEVDLPTGPFTVLPTKTKSGDRTGKTQHTFTDTTATNLSKNKFKTFLKNMVGKPIPFFVEDFVATDNNNPHRWNFYGQSYTYNFTHEIVGEVTSEMAEKVMESYNCAEGTILDAYYNKTNKVVTIVANIIGVTEYAGQTCH